MIKMKSLITRNKKTSDTSDNDDADSNDNTQSGQRANSTPEEQASGLVAIVAR